MTLSLHAFVVRSRRTSTPPLAGLLSNWTKERPCCSLHGGRHEHRLATLRAFDLLAGPLGQHLPPYSTGDPRKPTMPPSIFCPGPGRRLDYNRGAWQRIAIAPSTPTGPPPRAPAAPSP